MGKFIIVEEYGTALMVRVLVLIDLEQQWHGQGSLRGSLLGRMGPTTLTWRFTVNPYSA